MRELNPFWKDGGKGLPKEENAEVKSKPVVGDGGKSWIRQAYKRAMEQATKDERSLEEVAAECWGSLERIHSMLTSVGIILGSLSGIHQTTMLSHSKTSSPHRHQERKQHGSAGGGFLKLGDDIGSHHLARPHFAGVGLSTRSPQCSHGWRRKAEQSVEEEDVKKDNG